MSGGHLLLFSVRFFKNDDAMYMMYMMYMMCMMYVYDVYDVYESNVIMWYELPYTIYHIYFTYVVYRFMSYIYKTHLTSYIVGHRIPQFQAGRRPPASQLMVALRCLGATLVKGGEVYGYFWDVCGLNRGKSKLFSFQTSSSWKFSKLHSPRHFHV